MYTCLVEEVCACICVYIQLYCSQQLKVWKQRAASLQAKNAKTRQSSGRIASQLERKLLKECKKQ